MELHRIYNKEDDRLSSKLEVEMKKRGRRIARLDCMITAIAINRNVCLYTLNTKHFKGFEEFGLKLYK